MELSDASRTDDKVGSTKRRSSILKVPRTSIKATPPEQEECQVEIRKPLEKRKSSRRVSFAPSNDVLLFSNEVKNGSPVRSPLQDLTTMAIHLDQRVNIGVAQDSIQPITGMETLLNAPLHLSQQKNKNNFKLFDDAQNDYGERTVMFTGDEMATMDMTHSHTILIANDSESPVTPDESYIDIPNCGNMDFTLTMEKSRSLRCAPAPSDQCLDPEFESFLASISKSGGLKDTSSSIKSSTAVAVNTAPCHQEKIDTHAFKSRLKACRAEGDQENKASAMSATGRNCPVLLTTVKTERNLGNLNNMDLIKTQTTSTNGNGILKTGKAVMYEEQGLKGNSFSQSSFSADPDDMELTRSQTVAINSKISEMLDMLRNERGAFTQDPNRTQIFSEDDHGMELTGALNVPLQESRHLTPKTKSPTWLFSEENRLFSATSATRVPNDQPVCSYYGATDSSGHDDMELTSSQTVTIDSKLVTEKPSKSKTRESLSTKRGVFFEDCCGMDMTEALTGQIVTSSHTFNKEPLTSLFPTQEMYYHPGCNDRMETVGLGSNKVRESAFSVSDDMEITESQTVVIDSKSGRVEMPPLKKTKSSAHVQPSQSYNTSVALSEADDMDITRCQTDAIDTRSLIMGSSLQNRQRKSISFMPSSNKASQRSDDCGMDMTTSLTVFIDHMSQSTVGKMTEGARFVPPSTQTVTGVNSSTAESSPDDMDITRSHTVVFDSTSLGITPSHRARQEKTVSMVDCKTIVSEDESALEMTQNVPGDNCHSTHGNETTATVSTISKTKAITQDSSHVVEAGHRSSQPLALYSDEMDMTKSQMVAIDSDRTEIGSHAPFRTRTRLSSYTNRSLLTGKDTISPSDQSACVDMTFQFGTAGLCSRGPTSDSEDMELTRSQTVAIESKHVGLSRLEEMEIMRDKSFRIETSLATVNPSCSASMSEAHETEMIKAVPKKMEATTMGISSYLAKPRETTIHFEQMDMSNIISHEPSDKDMELTRSQTVAIESKDFGPSGLEEIGVDMKQNNVTDRNDPELRSGDGYIPHKPKSSPIAGQASEQEIESSKKAKSRRRSLADLQSRIQHMSNMINESTEVMRVGSLTAPLSHLVKTSEKPFVENESQPTLADRCGSKTLGLISDRVDNELDSHNSPDEKTFMTTSLNLKSKHLASRLSFGVFLPKLPQRTRSIDQNLTESSRMSDVEKPVKSYSIGITDDLCSNAEIDNIGDEELPNISSEEELSETLNTKSQGFDDRGNSGELLSESVLEDAVIEDPVLKAAECQQRPFPEDCHDNSIDDEKRRKPCTEMEPPSQIVQWSSATVTVDRSNSSNPTNIGIESTFESTYRDSQFECHLKSTEDYTFDVRKKLEDGSITVIDFLKLFNIDFVIHKPRQSILPARVLSDLDRKTEDLLTEKHIIHPKKRVYETDCQKLTEMVEELKARMREQDNPLKSVNKALWEAMKGFSEEELQHFGTKLKERRNLFRKRSKVESHKMKAVLYSDLVQTTQQAHQNLRENIEKADEMLKNLDDCLLDLETELAAVEGTGGEDGQPTLKSRQQGLEYANKSLAESERQMCELEIQRKHSVEKLDRLQAETRELENYKVMMDWVNEWRIGHQDDDRSVYTSLHESLQLEVLFEKPYGTDEIYKTDRNVMNISFQLQLNDEESQCQARLVHKLLSQYLSDIETTLVKRYPTSEYVPKLLHDVGLVVSRCRLLGEEIHLLKKWGSLRFNILDISCVDTQIHIRFSSLKAFVKFEMTVAVSHAYPFCLLQLQNFQNRFGNTTIHQLEEIVFSVTPSKNYLTKIVKSIHNTLLR